MPSSGGKTCARSEEHTSELQSHDNLVCRLLLEKKQYYNLQPGALIYTANPEAAGAVTPGDSVYPATTEGVVAGKTGDRLEGAIEVFFLISGQPPKSSSFPPPAALPF